MRVWMACARLVIRVSVCTVRSSSYLLGPAGRSSFDGFGYTDDACERDIARQVIDMLVAGVRVALPPFLISAMVLFLYVLSLLLSLLCPHPAFSLPLASRSFYSGFIPPFLLLRPLI